MKTVSRLAGFLGVAALIGLISCSDSENAQLSPAVKQYLSMRMGSNNAMAENMIGPVNRSFQSLFNQASMNGKVASDSSEVPGDTTIIEDPWQSCAVVTNQTNEDGSQTAIYDYGTGCEEGWEGYKYFMHGKYTSTYRNTESREGSVFKSTYFYASQYDNYGGNYNGLWSWVMNGGGTYSGQSEYDSVSQEFSGAYAYDDETTYQYDSVTYFYKSKGTSSYSNEKFTIKTSENNYTYGTDFYQSKVLKPLVADYSCYNQSSANFCFFWMFVEGRERVQYKNGDDEGSFEIDYGDGSCDNIVTIYEDGRVTRIDLGKDLNSDGPVVMQ